MLTLTTLRQVPPAFIGFVRDLRVRWALEEAGLPYQVRQVGPEEQASSAYRAEQPFGQIPVLRDGDSTVFESGAILLHLGQTSAHLLPADPQARSSALQWMFAALNSVEPHVAGLAQFRFAGANGPEAQERGAQLEKMAERRLGELDAALHDRDYLAGEFSAADILMVCVLRLLGSSGMLARHPRVHAYVERCTARPAFRKALADHRASFEAAAA
ncbi:MAG: glutathione S-transferase family protein [Telluria sp.]